MEESCELYLVSDGNPKNLSKDNIILIGPHTVFNKTDRPINVGDGIKMSIVRDEMMDEPVQLKIIQIKEESPKKLILCHTKECK